MHSDPTTATVHYAIDALNRSADARAHNIANVNTPGFRAHEVGFQAQLADAVRRGDVASAGEPATQPTQTFPDANGNTADLEHELTELMSEELLRNAMINAYNHKTGVLKTAITGQSR